MLAKKYHYIFSIREKILRKIYNFFDIIFDLLNGIKTNGIIDNSNLNTLSPYRENATAFQSVWCRNIRKLIKEAKKNGYRDCLFVDVGCGTGKACFYASKFNFIKIIGFDFDETLIDKAIVNKRNFTGQREKIEFFVSDATKYILPKTQCFVFMFNPFDEKVMSIFISNNLDIIKSHCCVVAYANDLQKWILERNGMKLVFREENRKISLWRF